MSNRDRAKAAVAGTCIALMAVMLVVIVALAQERPADPVSIVGTYYIGDVIPSSIVIEDEAGNRYVTKVDPGTAFWAFDDMPASIYYHRALVHGIPRERELLSYSLRDDPVLTHNVIVLPEGAIAIVDPSNPVGNPIPVTPDPTIPTPAPGVEPPATPVDTRTQDFRLFLPLILR